MARDKPYYPHLPIGSLSALNSALGLTPSILSDITKDTSKSYTTFLITTKGDKHRDVYDPKFQLKRIQKRINSRIFEKVEYPPYLQGGIRDTLNPRDYVENSRVHADSKTLISLDLRNFYHSIHRDSVFSIFKHFFKFPQDVSDILTETVMLEGKVPQGACTSSYVANLIFHNSEYQIVSKLSRKGIRYTRLLDDITISSSKELNDNEITEAIKLIAAMVKKHELKLHPKKTKIERSSDTKADYKVTGVWVGHKLPKLRKSDRRYIRQLVYICEKKSIESRYDAEYHDLWNRASGHVAKMARFSHHQAKQLRHRLSKILPLYDENEKSKILIEANKLIKKPAHTHSRFGVMRSYHRTIHRLGILSRTDKSTAKRYRKILKERFSDMPTNAEYWENG